MPSFTYGELKWSYNHILKQARKKKSDQSESSESSESESVKSVESAKSSGFENAKNQNRFEVEERERRNVLEAGHPIIDNLNFCFLFILVDCQPIFMLFLADYCCLDNFSYIVWLGSFWGFFFWSVLKMLCLKFLVNFNRFLVDFNVLRLF